MYQEIGWRAPHFGDIFYAELAGGLNIQGGRRPVVISQNDVGNKYSTTVEVIPMTAQINKASYMPTHVLIHPNAINHLSAPSIVLAEQIVTIHKDQLLNYVGSLTDDSIILIGRARRVQSPWPA